MTDTTREDIIKEMVHSFLKASGFSQFYGENSWLQSGLSDRSACSTLGALGVALYQYSRQITEPDFLFETMTAIREHLIKT